MTAPGATATRSPPPDADAAAPPRRAAPAGDARGGALLAHAQPVRRFPWASAININKSADATALEHLMDAAHLACANLIIDLFTIDHPGAAHEDGMRQRHERIRAWVQQQQQASG
jgi:hypothetical protein